MNWADARNECKKRGGDLASLTNPKDFDRMYTEIGETGSLFVPVLVQLGALGL